LARFPHTSNLSERPRGRGEGTRMDFAQTQRSPTRHLMGIGAVILLHIVIIYALLTGLARKVVEVVKAPLQVKVIEETRPPPPPDLPPPPPPKLAAPPPPFIPPPEVQIATPPPPVPVITAVTTVAPPEPTLPRDVPVPVPAPAPPAPTHAQIGVTCPNWGAIRSEIGYPRQAQLDNIQGDVTIEFTVGPTGEIKDATIVKSANRVFNAVTMKAVRALKCVGQGQDVKVIAPFTFRLE
jgi:protein TonB